MVNRKVLVEKLSKKIKDAETSNKVEGLVKDNKHIFNYKKKKYKVHKPNHKEKEKNYSAKSKKFIELLKDPSNILEEQLVELYKKKGVDLRVNVVAPDTGFKGWVCRRFDGKAATSTIRTTQAAKPISAFPSARTQTKISRE